MTPARRRRPTGWRMARRSLSLGAGPSSPWDAARSSVRPSSRLLLGTGAAQPLGHVGHLAEDIPGALGTERPLGQGSVGMERFVATLREIGFTGSLNIEREVESQEQRIADMRMGAELLGKLI